jgi:hypothetical protein
MKPCIKLFTAHHSGTRIDTIYFYFCEFSFKGFKFHFWKKEREKYLWVHWDEKWFWGAVRRMAKECPAKNLSRQQRHTYHKNVINKVMAIFVAGYAFEGTSDNGGCAVKIAKRVV